MAHFLLASAMLKQVRAREWEARLELHIERRGEASVLASNRHDGPLRVQKALYPEGRGVVHALIIHPPGGIAGGDHLHIDVNLAASAQVLLTTPGAAKWYKSGGDLARQDIRLRLGDHAVLEWLPQESIVFDGAEARQTLCVDASESACCIGWDISVLGRRGADETFRHGSFGQHIELRRGGRLQWAERAWIDGGDVLLQSPVGWDGAHVSGILWAMAPAAFVWEEAIIEDLRSLLDATCPVADSTAPKSVVRLDDTLAAVTLIRQGEGQGQGILLVRALGHAPERVRNLLTGAWTRLRPLLTGRAAHRPRIWAT